MKQRRPDGRLDRKSVIVVEDGVEQHIELTVILPAVARVRGEQHDPTVATRYIDERGLVLRLFHPGGV